MTSRWRRQNIGVVLTGEAILREFVGYLVLVEGFDYGVEVVGEVFHGSVSGGSAGFSLTNIGSLNTAGGAGEVALGVVAHHKDLVWLEPHHLKLL